MSVKIVAIAGSMRRESFNRKLLTAAVPALQAAGAEVDVVDLKALDIPLYDGDLEEELGLPAGVQTLKRRIGEAHGLLIVSPEYNASIPGVLKNALDWASRGEDDVFEGKLAAIMAASPGRFGGMRMMPHLRQVLTMLGLWLLPDQITVAGARDAFDSDGRLVQPFYAKQVQELAKQLVDEVQWRVTR